MTDDLTLIGNAVRTERLRRRRSIDAAAAAAGMSHVTWRRIERGQRVHARSMFAAREFLGLTSDTHGQVATDSVVASLVCTAVLAGRMRVLAGFGGAQ